MSEEVNSVALPSVSNVGGLKFPAEEDCVLNPNYQVTLLLLLL